MLPIWYDLNVKSTPSGTVVIVLATLWPFPIGAGKFNTASCAPACTTSSWGHLENVGEIRSENDKNHKYKTKVPRGNPVRYSKCYLFLMMVGI